MMATREVSLKNATTVTQMTVAQLAELGGADVQAAPDTELAAELLATKNPRPFSVHR